ncbi:hypothetical protein N7548_01495 [Acholeplasma manati]|uniref:Uncharacterized protein n=1 Tax=Paracholeplasma manati TaxID=591373 RepID=A0ABT2Y438_9MOLU|nr:hypothetical protein [Paracholeplasma manati]MCV2231502.1 hypothetical protein [Paracholeplasma manati]
MVNTYIVNAFHSGSYGTTPVKGIIKRDNLTLVPELIKYDREDIGDIIVLSNTLGVIITIQPYGSFTSSDKALRDYLGDPSSPKYEKTYNELKTQVLNRYGKSDTDWNMIIYVSKKEIQDATNDLNRLYVTDNIDINHYKTYGFIDCCFIYESIYYIKEFLNNNVNKNNLTKIDSYLIGFYLGTMNKVVKPSSFLVNKDELALYNLIYEKWDISMNLTLNINSTVSIIDMLTFTWKHDKEKRQKITSYLVTMLSLTLSFTSLYEFFEGQLLKRNVTIFYIVLMSIVIVMFSFHFVQYILQFIRFKRHIHK